MCEICTNNIQVNVNQYDPTRTTTLRNLFASKLRGRFNELTKVVREAIVDRDCFGLQEGNIVFQQMIPPGYRAFDFPSSAAKLDAFMGWFQTQIDRGILQTGNLQDVWTNKYVTDSYKRGAMRARYEMQKAGFDVPSMESTGGISATMQAPVHVDSLQLLYTRVYNELKGITEAMDQQISRVLAQGFADGDNPRLLARKLVSTINGSGMGDLGITDTLGRFVPARRRAEMLARTEIIRAHHMAMINEYELWAVEENYRVKAEFLTAGDNRVCPVCAGLEGNIYTLDQARGLIPVHPGCRCILLPYRARGETSGLLKGKEIKGKDIDYSPSPISSVIDAKKIIRDKYGVVVGADSNLSLLQMNAIAETLGNDIFMKFPNLAKKLKVNKLNNIYLHQASPLPLESRFGYGIQGYYDESAIWLSKNSLKTFKNTLNLNRFAFSIGDDFKSVIRHEFGHHIHTKILTSAERNIWQDFFIKNERLIKTKVSKYAATNANEAFAEVFSAYSSPVYGKKWTGGVLPKEIEDLFKKLLGE